MEFKIILFCWFFVFGLCIGSFLNVVIYRLPLGISIAKGRSMCPRCTHTLGALDLIPVISFLFLRRKCRYCGAPIAWRYPCVELLTGVLFGLCGAVYGFFSLGYAIILCVFMSALVIAWFVDLDHTYIPDRVHLIILGVAAASLFCGPPLSLTSRLIGSVSAGGFLWLLSALTHGGIGGGDIKLMATAGLLLGWPVMLPALFFAYILAACRYAVPLLKKQVDKNFEAPMAPFFAISLMIFSLWGERIVQWYLSFVQAAY